MARITKKKRQEFEDLLALFLWGELNQEGLGRLFQMVESVPEFRRSFEQHRNLDTVLQRTIEPAAKPTKSIRMRAAAATVLVLLAGGALFFILTGKSDPVARLTLKIGTCKSGKTLMNTGAALPLPKMISNENSVCDFQIDAVGKPIVRLYPNSSADYRTEPGAVYIRLERGRMLVDATRLKSNEKLELSSTGIRARILGTQVLLARKANGSTRLDVLKGRVRAIRGNHLLTRDFSSKLTESETIALRRRYRDIFREQARTLTSGDSLRGRPPALSPAEREVIIKLQTALIDNAGSTDAIRRVLDNLTKRQISIIKRSNPTARQVILRSRARSGLQKSFSSMRRLPPSAMRSAKQVRESLRTGTPDKSKILKNILAPDLPNYRQKLTLKDGRILTGIVYQKGAYYIVITPRGLRRIPAKLVDGVELILEE